MSLDDLALLMFARRGPDQDERLMLEAVPNAEQLGRHLLALDLHEVLAEGACRHYEHLRAAFKNGVH